MDTESIPKSASANNTATSAPKMSRDVHDYILLQLHAGKSRQQILDELPWLARLEIGLAATAFGVGPRYLLETVTNVLAKMEHGGLCFGCDAPIEGEAP